MPYKSIRKNKACQKAYRLAHREELKAYSKKYYETHKKKAKITNAAYHFAHKERENARRRRHYRNNKENQKIRMAKNRIKHQEAVTVRSHHYVIFNAKASQHRNYAGIPFFDGWNPDKGGSIAAGESWIIKNLGKRPKGSTMHIVDHSLGFVPGNLEWTHPRRQAHQQMHKIIAQQRNKIKKLEERIKELEGAL